MTDGLGTADFNGNVLVDGGSGSGTATDGTMADTTQSKGGGSALKAGLKLEQKVRKTKRRDQH